MARFSGGSGGGSGAPGPTGPQGPAGADGQGLVWRGAWGPNTYAVNDVVTFEQGGKTSVYIRTVVDGTNMQPSTLMGWALMVSDGNTGEAGQGFTWRGEWSETEEYSINDLVAYNGSVYLFLNFMFGNVVPDSNPMAWGLFASKGEAGEGFTWRGEWQFNNQYYTNDVVFFEGTCHIATSDNSGNSPRDDFSNTWDLLATGIKWRGTWDFGYNTSYTINDVVLHENNLYIGVSSAPNIFGAPGEDSGWQLFLPAGTGGGADPATLTTLGTVYGKTTLPDLNNWPATDGKTILGYNTFAIDNVYDPPIVTEGDFSTIIGYNAISTHYGVAVGANTAAGLNLEGTTTHGVAVGHQAIVYGQNGVAVGRQSWANTADSVAIGYYGRVMGGNEGTAVGAGAYVTTDSHGGVAVGYNSYLELATNSIAIGKNAKAADWVNYSGITNAIAIGYNAEAITDNTIVLGNSSIASLQCAVQTISALSDERDKTNIEPLNLGLDFINTLNPVKFEWNMRDGGKVGDKDFGFIAQDLAAAEDAVEMHETLGLTNRNDPEKLLASYGKLVPILVQAIKDLSNEVNELKEKIND